MLNVAPYQMILTGQTWHQVVDETGATLGALGTEEAAVSYKLRLERAGIHSAADMLARIKDERHRNCMAELMLPGLMAGATNA